MTVRSAGAAGAAGAARYVEQPTNASREMVNAMLRRARRFHCSVSGTSELDVTALRARLRQERRAGRELSLTAFIVKATARLIEEQPHLNRHQFTGLFGRRRIVEFSQIHCTLVVARRTPAREEILLPGLLADVNRRSLDDIEAEIRRLKSAPLAELPQMRDLARLDKLPRVAIDLLSYKARSDPDFYLRFFGTYGVSSLVRVGGHGTSAATLANTGVAFLPGSIRKLPRFVEGRVEAREILGFGFVFDHYLFDGIQMLRATERLGEFLEDPDILLGPARAPGHVVESVEP